eukprot:CAMPEP_0181057524 /NCGR_PEP_ID=MMETSP1070-20121207/20296_1 /TAXON_ID=265543 /ORGANISM="Minutocellus polymorphus, Strain NH13" /LENGTH=54 /DNA_ID=CAMNT_0023136943 /DNA_START=169 /DNA_END=333 /DNA_ORIENTATION=-
MVDAVKYLPIDGDVLSDDDKYLSPLVDGKMNLVDVHNEIGKSAVAEEALSFRVE